MNQLVNQFADLLREHQPNEQITNPWNGFDLRFDENAFAPEHRTIHLKAYLDERLDTAEALLIAEAPGYQGARFSGIPMTCERTLLGHRTSVSKGDVFSEAVKRNRTSSKGASTKAIVMQKGFCEPTAAYVWGYMSQNAGLTRKIVLWNIYAFHPHPATHPLKNRTPTEDEILANRPILEAFLKMFPDRPILSIGNESQKYLRIWGRQINMFTRHPANAGGSIFRENLATFSHNVGLLA